MKLILAFLIASVSVFAQNQTKVSPDCTSGAVVLSSGGASLPIDNRPTSPLTGVTCTTWVLTYTASTGSPAISIAVQEAPNNNGIPGSFSNISGATSTTTPSGSILVTHSAGSGYYPFIRINLASVASGTVSAVLNGWRDNAASVSGGSSSSGCPNPCPVIGETATGSPPSTAPVYSAGIDGSGNIVPIVECTLTAVVNISSSGNNQVVAPVGGKTLRICNVDLSFPSPAAFAFQLTQGTGSNCGTGTANVGGLITVTSAVLGSFDDPGSTSPYVLAAAGNALCINLSTGVTVQGTIHYAAPF